MLKETFHFDNNYNDKTSSACIGNKMNRNSTPATHSLLLHNFQLGQTYIIIYSTTITHSKNEIRMLFTSSGITLYTCTLIKLLAFTVLSVNNIFSIHNIYVAYKLIQAHSFNEVNAALS